MKLRPLLLAAVLALSGCAGQGLTGDTFRPAVYEVRPGDTLHSIAWRYGLDHRELQRWNGLDSPHLLRVGQELRLRPDAEASRSARRGEGSSDEQPRSQVQRESEPETSARTRPAPERKEPVRSGGPAGAPTPTNWRWPADGKLVGRFGDQGVAGRGIELAGEMGSPVTATAAGEVVYSGEGLQAYGQLVIIRHGDEFLSAYAHNDRLLVKEGQQVAAGERIAGMGRTNDGRVLLHFEIRRQGTPVNPLDYLPARE